MIDLNQIVEVLVATYNIKHYRENGYPDVKKDDKIFVELKNVHPGFRGNVEVVCDGFGTSEIMGYQKYLSLCVDGVYYSKEYTKAVKKLEKITNYYDMIIKFCNNHDYELITSFDKIENNKSEVQYICPIHGLQTTKVTSIQQGKICYLCSRIIAGNKKWSHSLDERRDQLYNMLIEKCNEKGYQLLTPKEKINANTDYIQYLCKTHGEHTMKIGNMIYNDRGCPDCNNDRKKPKALKEYKQIQYIPYNKLQKDVIIERVGNSGGIILNPDDYINNTTKNLQILCPECGEPFITSFRNFTQHDGQLCEKCHNVKSVGENKISIYLRNRDISFIHEKWFSDCRAIKPLPFDFYIEELNCIIEYDGIHHFAPVYGEDIFLTIQYHDWIKNEYCKNHGIKIIRIPYWDIDKIDEILDINL